MPSKRRKKSGKGFAKSLKTFAMASSRLVLKALPLAAVLLLTGTAFVGVKQVLYADTHLALRSLVVEPLQALTSAQRQSLESHYIGKNILRIDLRRIALELERDPRIKRAHVFRRFPTDLRIEIEERVPVGLVRFEPRGPVGLVAEDGVILDIFQKEPPPSYPVIEAFQSGLKRPEQGMSFRAKGFAEAIQFLKAFWVASKTSSAAKLVLTPPCASRRARKPMTTWLLTRMHSEQMQ